MKLNAISLLVRNKMSAKKITPNPLKALLRKEVDEKLASITKEEMDRQTKIVTEKILNHPKYKISKRIALFLSLPAEIDTAVILKDILSRGNEPFVPQYGRGKMRMLRVLEGDVEAMPATKWGIKQHAAEVDREDAIETGGLDLIIAPGVAFTRKGHRLGHGGGYYDRFLHLLKQKHEQDETFTKPYVLAVGFNEQIYDEIPIDSHDFIIDEVVTAE